MDEVRTYTNHQHDSRVTDNKDVNATLGITNLEACGKGTLVTFPINSMVLGKELKDGDRQTVGVGEADEALPTLQSAHHHAVAIAENIIGRKVENGGNGVGATEELAYTQNATGVMGVSTRSLVRRITPIEAERLMGFPDNYTRISWNGKPEEECPDSHRYKCCGNSMSVNCMEWIGMRIEEVERKLRC